MNRINEKFKQLKRLKKKAFIPFITAGDPTLKITKELVRDFEKAGADIIELGIPFSDPLADGPTIQAASQRALKRDVSLLKILNMVKTLRKEGISVPIALMTYYNPIFHYGERSFILAAKESGVDGLIIPDLPPEEARVLISLTKKAEISTIFFISPTTTKLRRAMIAQKSTGFIYYVSLTGVTGTRQTLSNQFIQDIKQIKKETDTPICVGFGISTASQVKSVTKIADGVIVGSAIVKEIEKKMGDKDLVKHVTRFVKSLIKAI